MKFIFENTENKEYILSYTDNGLNVLDFWMNDKNDNMYIKNLLNLKEKYDIILSHDKDILHNNVLQDRYLIRLRFDKPLKKYNKLKNDYKIIDYTDVNKDKINEFLNEFEELTIYRKTYEDFKKVNLLINRCNKIIGIAIFGTFSNELLLEYYFIIPKIRRQNLGVYFLNKCIEEIDTTIVANVESFNEASYKTLIKTGFKVFNHRTYISFR